MLAEWKPRARRFLDGVMLAPRDVVGEAAAGTMGALVAIAYAVSYAALMFVGPLATGLGPGIWSFMVGTAVSTMVIALTTSLTPVTSGPRNPTVAVLSVLVADAGLRALTAGASVESAVATALMSVAIASLVTGAALAALGMLRLGQAVRFVPFPVIAGFLGASGWLLIAGGLKVAEGASSGSPAPGQWLSAGASLRIAFACLFAGAMLWARRRGAPSAILPAAFFVSAAAVDLAFWLSGVPSQDWYLGGATRPAAWWPPGLVAHASVDWNAIVLSSVELGAVVGVAMIALLLDVTTVEVQRSVESDMDAEFCWNGVGNLLAAPLGGAPAGMAPNTARLIEEAGGASRLAALMSPVVITAVLVSGVDLVAFLPRPVLGGLLILVGVGVLRDAVASAPGSRSPTEVALALAITFSIVQFGYLPGVVVGLVASCIAFAVRYSRVGVIRRHLTRATFAAPVERPTEDKALLAADGGRIHIFWLSGFIFFGSSNGVYEAIRAAVGDGPRGERRWVVLDLSAVSGLDTSAMLSFAKLASWSRRNNVGLSIAGADDAVAGSFGAQSFVTDGHVRLFATRNDALEVAERELLDEQADSRRAEPMDAFKAWLERELGAEASHRLVSEGYLQRRKLTAGELICRQDAPSDSIELIAAGSVAIVFRKDDGEAYRVRRMTGRTVVGEMGFFRALPRTTSVVAEGEAIVYVMTRESYERLRTEQPQDGGRFLEFIVRQLADRVEFTTKEIASLI